MSENCILTLGSLFDGSGGFPLGGILAGIQPVWASEVEPFAIRVTTKRLPGMTHYGDVSRLDGAALPPVDIITFGSPCQDMSIAGKRAGLDGSRSGLFHEAIRIIKEMRKATDGKYPRYIVWENVPGAFSSNGGADFRSVLEEICRVKDSEADVPQPDRWEHAGRIMGEDFSVAWRVFDSQHWGVPQRRKRIYLVADFAGQGASKVLFESDGLSGYSAEGIGAWQRTACRAEDGAGASGGGLTWCVNPQGSSGISVTEDQTGTLVAQDHGHHPAVLQSAGFCTEHSAKARSIGYEEEMSPTLRAGVVPVAMSVQHNPTDGRMKLEEDGKAQTLTGRMGTGGNNVPLVAEPEPMTMKIRCGKEGGGKGALIQQDTFGHWESDTVLGRKKSGEPAVFTLVERLTGYYFSIRIDSKTTAGVAAAMEQLKAQYGDRFSQVFRSITTDNGNEFAAFSAFEALGTDIYFAHPYSAWERPVNERTNRLLRRFIPKGRSIHDYTDEQILMFADEIDALPRKRLCYRTPEELFEEQLDRIYAAK